MIPVVLVFAFLFADIAWKVHESRSPTTTEPTIPIPKCVISCIPGPLGPDNGSEEPQ